MQLEYKIGDCIKLLGDIPDKSVDLILTDLSEMGMQINMGKLLEQYKRVIKNNRVIILISKQPLTSMLIMNNLNMFKQEYVWVKNKGNSLINSRDCVSVLVFSKDNQWNQNDIDPDQKAFNFYEYAIKTYTNEGDLVHDSCLGSGTVLEVCQSINRDCLGFDGKDLWEQNYKNIIASKVPIKVDESQKDDAETMELFA